MSQQRIFRFISALCLVFLGSTAHAALDPSFATPTVIADFGATTRPFGIAAGDFDGDGAVDLFVGRVSGNFAFIKGNGDGTFATPVTLPWKQTSFNAVALTAGDVNNDGKLDVIWGVNLTSTGCSVYPPPSPCPLTVTVTDGEVRAFLGNGNGTFQENLYYVSTNLHNAGALLGSTGLVDAGSIAVGDVDDDGDVDIVVGAANTTTTAIKLLRNAGGTFTVETIASQPYTTALTSPIYYPAVSTQNSPWGLALGDADNDGDLDLWVGDRALYVYLYKNNGAGSFAMQTGNSAVATRPNAYLAHESFRAVVGYTPALASADLNGDARADLVLGLQSGAQTTAVAHDGELLLDASNGGGHFGLGALADIGMVARGVTLIDVNGDALLDIVAGEYSGKVYVLLQLPPIDNDNDGISDYVDNALNTPNASRLDMNGDGILNYRDQLDNDADTVLGNPQDPATWQRLGDPDDADDDNDGAPDGSDNCVFVPNSDQADRDGDGVGDACDPLDNRDADNDGVADGPAPGDPMFDLARDAKKKWASGHTRFVIRIDALGRFFQNEFTQLMTDAAALSPADWAAKCWENYDPGDMPGDPTYEPCGADSTKTLTLGGGKEVPITLITIPKMLWTDPPVVSWINDRNNDSRLEIGQHATYHTNNVPVSDWANLGDRNFFSCEMCGLTEAENFQLLKVGFDTLAGNYSNKWVRESGATDGSPKIDWSTSAWPLISFAPPFNASDALGRKATAQLGFKSFSASVFEEEGPYASKFTPEGSHHERFDQFGMFHASADIQLEPPNTSGDTYDPDAYANYLQSMTDDHGLTTWLIEEVDWSGRPCNNADRLGTCDGQSNRENNTVYQPRWDAWLQVLDFVKNYPGGVAMTAGEVALALAYDNAPTVSNPDQADTNANGIGDVIEGATIETMAATLSRHVPGKLQVKLVNGNGDPLAGQRITFEFDADGNGEDDVYEATTGSDGKAEVTVTATRDVGGASYLAKWDGVRVTAVNTAVVNVFDATSIVLDATNPTSGQTTDSVSVGATLVDTDSAPLADRTLSFTIGSNSASAVTDAAGHATATVALSGPAATPGLLVSFAGADPYGPSSASGSFAIQREDTLMTLSDAIATKNSRATARAVLTEADGAPVAGRTITLEAQVKVRAVFEWVPVGSGVTGGDGAALIEVPTRYVGRTASPIRARFDGDASFTPATASASVLRN